MKILLTTPVFLPDFFGGTETLVHGIAMDLTQRGHSVTIVTGYPDNESFEADDCFDEYTYDAIRVMRFKYHTKSIGRQINRMRNDYGNLVFEAGFRKLLDESAPDIVHFHHFGRLSIKAIDACIERHIPTFLTVTDFWSICPQQSLLLPNGKMCDGPSMGGANCLKHMVSLTQSENIGKMVNIVPDSAIGVMISVLKGINVDLPGDIGVAQALAKRSKAIADRLPLLTRIFVPTRFTQSTLEKNGIVTDKFRILPFGLKDNGYVRRARRRSDKPLVLGFIGQFLQHKGLHVLMEAMHLLPADCPINLKVYAKLPEIETAYATDLLAQLDKDPRVKFEGVFENEKIPAVLDEIDALVIPSIWHENMPLVSLSAQASGCPLIASDVGGLSDVIVHGKNGLLFQPGSASELRDCILQLLSDENLLYLLSNSAISPPSLTQYVDDLESEYRHSTGEKE